MPARARRPALPNNLSPVLTLSTSCEIRLIKQEARTLPSSQPPTCLRRASSRVGFLPGRNLMLPGKLEIFHASGKPGRETRLLSVALSSAAPTMTPPHGGDRKRFVFAGQKKKQLEGRRGSESPRGLSSVILPEERNPSKQLNS